MPQIISPSQIVMTKDGEIRVTIALELNINVNASGQVSTSIGVQPEIEPPKSKFDEVEWDLPELSSGVKVEFGKKIQE
jgi:hypothetical protein